MIQRASYSLQSSEDGANITHTLLKYLVPGALVEIRNMPFISFVQMK